MLKSCQWDIKQNTKTKKYAHHVSQVSLMYNYKYKQQVSTLKVQVSEVILTLPLIIPTGIKNGIYITLTKLNSDSIRQYLFAVLKMYIF
jgi:hypothetical protein